MEKVIDLFGDIWYYSAELFKNQIQNLKKEDKLVCRMHNYGGSVMEGLAILNLTKELECDSEVKILGICASIATVISAGFKKVKMAKSALFMVHRPMLDNWEYNINGHEKAIATLETIEKSLLDVYSIKTGKDKEYLKAKYFDKGEDVFLTADEAKAEGFVDEIIEDVVPNASAMANFAKMSFANRMSLFNQIKIETIDNQSNIEKKEEMNTEKIEDLKAQLTAVESEKVGLQAKVNELESEKMKTEKQVTALNSDIELKAKAVEDLKTEKAQLEASVNEFKAKAEKLETENKKLQIQNVIEKATSNLVFNVDEKADAIQREGALVAWQKQFEVKQESGEVKVFNLKTQAFEDKTVEASFKAFCEENNLLHKVQAGVGASTALSQTQATIIDMVSITAKDAVSKDAERRNAFFAKQDNAKREARALGIIDGTDEMYEFLESLDLLEETNAWHSKNRNK